MISILKRIFGNNKTGDAPKKKASAKNGESKAPRTSSRKSKEGLLLDDRQKQLYPVRPDASQPRYSLSIPKLTAARSSGSKSDGSSTSERKDAQEDSWDNSSVRQAKLDKNSNRKHAYEASGNNDADNRASVHANDSTEASDNDDVDNPSPDRQSDSSAEEGKSEEKSILQSQAKVVKGKTEEKKKGYSSNIKNLASGKTSKSDTDNLKRLSPQISQKNFVEGKVALQEAQEEDPQAFEKDPSLVLPEELREEFKKVLKDLTQELSPTALGSYALRWLYNLNDLVLVQERIREINALLDVGKNPLTLQERDLKGLGTDELEKELAAAKESLKVLRNFCNAHYGVKDVFPETFVGTLNPAKTMEAFSYLHAWRDVWSPGAQFLELPVEPPVLKVDASVVNSDSLVDTSEGSSENSRKNQDSIDDKSLQSDTKSLSQSKTGTNKAAAPKPANNAVLASSNQLSIANVDFDSILGMNFDRDALVFSPNPVVRTAPTFHGAENGLGQSQKLATAQGKPGPAKSNSSAALPASKPKDDVANSAPVATSTKPISTIAKPVAAQPNPGTGNANNNSGTKSKATKSKPNKVQELASQKFEEISKTVAEKKIKLSERKTEARRLGKVLGKCIPPELREDSRAETISLMLRGMAAGLAAKDTLLAFRKAYRVNPKGYAQGLLDCKAACDNSFKVFPNGERRSGWLPQGGLRDGYLKSDYDNPLRWCEDLDALRSDYLHIQQGRATQKMADDYETKCNKPGIKKLVEDLTVNLDELKANLTAWNMMEKEFFSQSWTGRNGKLKDMYANRKPGQTD